jgi:threonine synthase
MQFYSTRNSNHIVNIDEAILNGIANDGGLYMPSAFTNVYAQLKDNDLHSVAENMLTPFIGGYFSVEEIKAIVRESFAFDVPLVQLNEQLYVAELFHGPTLAFKDFGGMFMANAMSRILQKQGKKLTILVATSGDTGGAVANGFFDKENIDVVILYPKGKVSDLQELQLTTFGKNITAIAVDGTFDDCQHLVKTAFADQQLKDYANLSSANSINIGRLIPQMIYYGYVSNQLFKEKNIRPTIVVPSGNFGNISAGLFAKRIGYPIARFIAATNANDVVPEYFNTGTYTPRPSVQTLSNAMDVGAPSNMERINNLFGSDVSKIKSEISAYTVSDEETKATMKSVYEKYNYVADPHTAVGLQVAEQATKNETCVVMSTAHPAKFKADVEQILGINITLPKQLNDLLNKPQQQMNIPNSFSTLKDFLLTQQKK